LEYITSTFGDSKSAELGRVSGSNLYHRLLECYLFKHQELMHEAQKKPSRVGSKLAEKYRKESVMEGGNTKEQIKYNINSLINAHDSKIDKHYVLFLFQIYDFSEGVKDCCNKLNLK
jgi:hypothetical protein